MPKLSLRNNVPRRASEGQVLQERKHAENDIIKMVTEVILDFSPPYEEIN